jgi:hypothetical protein
MTVSRNNVQNQLDERIKQASHMPPPHFPVSLGFGVTSVVVVTLND